MIKLVNELAVHDVLVVFQTAGSGTFNCDARRLAGLQQKLPPLLVDPDIKFFKPLQVHYDLCRFGTTDVKVSFLVWKIKRLFCICDISPPGKCFYILRNTNDVIILVCWFPGGRGTLDVLYIKGPPRPQWLHNPSQQSASSALGHPTTTWPVFIEVWFRHLWQYCRFDLLHKKSGQS